MIIYEYNNKNPIVAQPHVPSVFPLHILPMQYPILKNSYNSLVSDIAPLCSIM